MIFALRPAAASRVVMWIFCSVRPGPRPGCGAGAGAASLFICGCVAAAVQGSTRCSATVISQQAGLITPPRCCCCHCVGRLFTENIVDTPTLLHSRTAALLHSLPSLHCAALCVPLLCPASTLYTLCHRLKLKCKNLSEPHNHKYLLMDLKYRMSHKTITL